MADLDAIKKLIDADFDKIASMPSLTDSAICELDKLADIWLDIDKIQNRENGGYSQRAYGLYYDDGSRNYDNSYRYSDDRYYDRGRSYDDGRGYSGDDRGVTEHLRKAMNMARDEKDREEIRSLMTRLHM